MLHQGSYIVEVMASDNNVQIHLREWTNVSLIIAVHV